MRILVVEDEKDLQDAIADGLRLDGYAVDTCSNGRDAYESLYIENYDLAILDLNLPLMNGMDVLEKIRAYNQELKILILSSRDSISDKVKGLDLGANDYLTKPFDFEELEARIRNLLRRQFKQENTLIECGKIQLDLQARNVKVFGKNILLTKKEFAILEYLMLNKNKVISQEELIEHIWDSKVDSFSGAIRVHIASLRKKLKNELGLDPIITKIGEGYVLSNKGES